MGSTVKEHIQEDVKAAMRGGDKQRLGALRMIMAAVKQHEVDTRTEADDAALLAILEKMVKQRRDAQSQFEAAGRQELADKEAYEIGVIQEFLPPALSESDITALIDGAIASTGAASPKDMGKVMGVLKPQMAGRADMAAVSKQVQTRLSGKG